MYRDFEDLRDNCPVSLRADIAIDLIHDNPTAWPRPGRPPPTAASAWR
ncbi:MAG: hypothetical protein IPO18_00365 [bacterium]|nr:hypothetical protein [bacterium]